jgi:hypothetical protein
MLGRGSNPAHGDIEAKGGAKKMRRGFRPTVVRACGQPVLQHEPIDSPNDDHSCCPLLSSAR